MANSDSSDARKVICLELLRAAKSDNERLAGLLLVPKLFSVGVKDSEKDKNSKEDNVTDVSESLAQCDILSPTFDVNFKMDLLSAIDFHFLKRLLADADNVDREDNSGTLSEDKVSLKLAALSVILCLSEPGVLSESQVHQIVTAIENILVAIETSIINDKEDAEKSQSKSGPTAEFSHLTSMCAQCLENFAKGQDLKTLEESIMPAIYRVVLKQQHRGDVADLLLSLVSDITDSRGLDSLSITTKLAVGAIYLHHIKLDDISTIDFALCERGARLISHLTDARACVPVKLHSLIDGVMGRLSDALKSKLPTQQRQQALKLLTGLIQVRGIKQLIDEKGSKAALLVIHLCSIEIRMTLEQDNYQQVITEGDTLYSSFFALEQMIFYMAHSETTLVLNGKEVLQVHSAMQGAVSAIIYFLTNCAADECIDRSLYAVVAACIRLLGAWTAEETESLFDKYTKLLPDLLTICGDLLSEMDSFKFLVPGLSNLTTDTVVIVEVIVDKMDFISQYIEHCSTKITQNKEEYEHVLVNCCVVVLNCLMMPGVKLSQAPISALLDSIAQQTIKIHMEEAGSSQLTASALTVGGDQEKYEPFCRQSIEYLLAISEKGKAEGAQKSADIPEIWLMGVQVLGELMKRSKLVSDILVEEQKIRSALSLFEQHSTSVDVTFVLERLLLTMAEKAGAKDLITKINKAKRK